MRILVFQHLKLQHAGVFREIWDAKGYEHVTVELDAGEAIPDFTGFDLLVVVGGPMDVWDVELHPWLSVEKAAIRRWVAVLEKPYLGICLGYQLLADALGGIVTPMHKPEVGVVEISLTRAGANDPLLDGFPAKWDVLSWHGAEVSALPDGAVALAENDACPLQAMRWGRHAYGLQYNSEITMELLKDWSAIPEYRASLEHALGLEGVAKLQPAVLARLPGFRAAAERLEENLCNLMKRPRLSDGASQPRV